MNNQDNIIPRNSYTMYFKSLENTYIHEWDGINNSMKP